MAAANTGQVFARSPHFLTLQTKKFLKVAESQFITFRRESCVVKMSVQKMYDILQHLIEMCFKATDNLIGNHGEIRLPEMAYLANVIGATRIGILLDG